MCIRSLSYSCISFGNSSVDVNGSDYYGFNALPGGYFDGQQQRFMNWKFNAVMWSNSEKTVGSDEFVYALYLRSNAKSQLTTRKKII